MLFSLMNLWTYAINTRKYFIAHAIFEANPTYSVVKLSSLLFAIVTRWTSINFLQILFLAFRFDLQELKFYCDLPLYILCFTVACKHLSLFGLCICWCLRPCFIEMNCLQI